MPTIPSTATDRPQRGAKLARAGRAAGIYCRAALTVLLATAAIQTAVADLAPGRRPRPRQDDDATSTLDIKIDATTKVATLRIPERLLKQISRAGESTGFLPPEMRTILAGLAMSAAAISLAFVLKSRRVQRNRELKIATGSLVAVVVTFGALGLALADIPPPPKRAADVLVVIEPVKDAAGVTLVLPAEMLPELQRLIAKAEEDAASADSPIDAKVKTEKPAAK